jgi:glucan phosphoethanolaminetransferase (alkaline phosphatase superfamily)
MSPVFKILYPSVYFWILLVGTIGFTIVLYINRINVARGILNPRELWFKKILLIYLVIFSCVVIGVFVYVNILNLYSGEIMAVAIFLYFVGFLFLSLSPVFLTTPEMAKKLEKMPVD